MAWIIIIINWGHRSVGLGLPMMCWWGRVRFSRHNGGFVNRAQVFWIALCVFFLRYHGAHTAHPLPRPFVILLVVMDESFLPSLSLFLLPSVLKCSRHLITGPRATTLPNRVSYHVAKRFFVVRYTRIHKRPVYTVEKVNQMTFSCQFKLKLTFSTMSNHLTNWSHTHSS